MGVFVAVYNYLTFRLIAPPTSLATQRLEPSSCSTWSAWSARPGPGGGRYARTPPDARLEPLLMLTGVALTLLASLPASLRGWSADVRFLRGTRGREQLDRRAGTRSPGTSVLALYRVLLRGSERHRHARWRILEPLRLDRRRRPGTCPHRCCAGLAVLDGPRLIPIPIPYPLTPYSALLRSSSTCCGSSCRSRRPCRSPLTDRRPSARPPDARRLQRHRAGRQPSSASRLDHARAIRSSAGCRFGQFDSVEAKRFPIRCGLGRLCARAKHDV